MLKLTQQQFGLVFDKLRQLGSTGGSEKRLFTRMQVQAKIRLASLNGDRVLRIYTALTRDVSAGGLGCFQFAPGEIGERLLVCLPTINNEIVLVSSVRFCRALAEGVFGLGLEYEEEAGKSLIAQLQESQNGALERIKQSMFT